LAVTSSDIASGKSLIGSSMMRMSVYQKQVDLVRAKAAEIQVRVNYAKAVIAQEQATGQLQENHGIVFEDALRGTL